MSEFLKGNFKVKNDVKERESPNKEELAESVADQLKKAALHTIGGSMVYMERKKLTWDDDGSKS